MLNVGPWTLGFGCSQFQPSAFILQPFLVGRVPSHGVPAWVEIPVTGSARQLSNNKTRETLFLLLGGEGQVEGERHRPKQITGIFLSAENAENADS
jgi:hypothetical protein